MLDVTASDSTRGDRFVSLRIKGESVMIRKVLVAVTAAAVNALLELAGGVPG